MPYGSMTSSVRQDVLQRAIYRGLPVVRVGRGSPEGFANPDDHFIAGSNLTATKARHAANGLPDTVRKPAAGQGSGSSDN